MLYTLETIDSVKCQGCNHRNKGAANGYYCTKYMRQLEHYRDRSGVWVTKCDECITGEAN